MLVPIPMPPDFPFVYWINAFLPFSWDPKESTEQDCIIQSNIRRENTSPIFRVLHILYDVLFVYIFNGLVFSISHFYQSIKEDTYQFSSKQDSLEIPKQNTSNLNKVASRTLFLPVGSHCIKSLNTHNEKKQDNTPTTLRL